MFNNPGRKLATMAKVMFWLFCSLFVVFDVVVSIIMSVIVAAIVGMYNSFARNIYMLSTLGLGGSNYSAISPDPFIIFIWVCAIFAAVIFVFFMYWRTLIVITNADTNIEVKEIRKALGDNGLEMNSQSYERPIVKKQAPRNVYQPVVNNPAPAYYPEPVYRPVYQPAPERVVVEAPTYTPPITIDSEQKYTPPTTVDSNQEYTPPQVEYSDDVVKENQETVQQDTKEDILSKYGPKGKIYK